MTKWRVWIKPWGVCSITSEFRNCQKSREKARDLQSHMADHRRRWKKARSRTISKKSSRRCEDWKRNFWDRKHRRRQKWRGRPIQDFCHEIWSATFFSWLWFLFNFYRLSEENKGLRHTISELRREQEK